MRIPVSYQGRDIEVEAEWISGALWFHFEGETHVWRPEVRQKSKTGPQRNEIVAPMPGKVTKVLKNPGDKVAAGDVVVVLEAMKMEYSLKADVAGVLGSLAVKPGDQTTLGQVLVEIKEDPA